MSTYHVLCLLIVASTVAEEYHYFPDSLLRHEDNLGRTEDFKYWKVNGQVELELALSAKLNKKKAKNVILFIGDGMSFNTVTAARILHGQRSNRTGESELLPFEMFPHVGIIKTYNVDSQVSDSAGTATAFLTGVKTSAGVLGVDATVTRGSCESVNDGNTLESLFDWFQSENKKTGIVTTAGITHATPAAGYAHTAHRRWECNAYILPEDYCKCPTLKDIALQLIEDPPGNKINVLLGGGLKHFDGTVTGTADDPVGGCIRNDGRQLHTEWLQSAGKLHNKKFIRTKSELSQVDVKDTDFILGLFSNGHLPYNYQIREKSLDVPSLKEMTAAAIKLLQQQNGFFLLVEGGRIDHAHHEGKAQIALDETLALSEAVSIAIEMVDVKDTLIIVTADHSHTMSFSGYQKRGNPILGVAAEGSDGKSYTTLMYSNGPGYSHTITNDTLTRIDPLGSDIYSYGYKQQATVPLKAETHGGDDVPLYAIGPMSHLFHSVHEQNYIAHAIAYAACVGDNTNHCEGSH